MTITYVGGQAGNGLSSAFPVTVTFALTGGTNAAPLAGDLVVVTGKGVIHCRPILNYTFDGCAGIDKP